MSPIVRPPARRSRSFWGRAERERRCKLEFLLVLVASELEAQTAQLTRRPATHQPRPRRPRQGISSAGGTTDSMRVLSSADRAVSLATTQALGSIAAGERQSRHGRLHPVWSRAPGAGPLLPGVRCARRGRRAGWGAEAGLRAVRGPRRLDRAGRLGGSGTDAGEARPLLRVHG